MGAFAELLWLDEKLKTADARELFERLKRAGAEGVTHGESCRSTDVLAAELRAKAQELGLKECRFASLLEERCKTQPL